jgi:hypothetical protein
MLKVSDSDSEKHLLVTVGDSHTRGCASKIKDILNKNFNGIGFVNPGSNTFTLANSAIDTYGNLTKNYILVFWGARRYK